MKQKLAEFCYKKPSFAKKMSEIEQSMREINKILNEPKK